MSRQELKELWWSLPMQPKVPKKLIIIEKCGENHYSVERITDVDGYWSKSSSNFNNAEEAMRRAITMKNDEYYTGYKLIIK